MQRSLAAEGQNLESFPSFSSSAAFPCLFETVLRTVRSILVGLVLAGEVLGRLCLLVVGPVLVLALVLAVLVLVCLLA